MKIQIKNELLNPALAKLIPLVNPIDTLASASMILLDASSGNKLTLSTTSINVEMSCSVSECVVKTPGKTLLPARRLFDISQKNLFETIVSIDCNDNQAKVLASDSKYQLNALPAKDFPLMDVSDTATAATDIRQDDFKFLFDKTTFSMADKDILHLLNGVRLSVGPDGLVMVATDRHRLAVCQTPLQTDLPEQVIILPRKAALEIQKLLEDSDSKAKIRVNPKYFEIVLDDTTVKVKLLEGEYPDYKKVIPTEFSQTIVVDVQTFKQTLTRACVVFQGEKKAAAARLSFDKQQLKISATNREGETGEATQAVEYSGDAVDIGFNPQYLNELLGVVSANELVFHIKDTSSGVLLREQAVDAVQYVIMPVRL